MTVMNNQFLPLPNWFYETHEGEKRNLDGINCSSNESRNTN